MKINAADTVALPVVDLVNGHILASTYKRTD